MDNLDVLILSNVRVPNSFYYKAKGLLGESEFKQNTAMLFNNCNSIHMMGMRISLDIVFLTSDGTILKCVKNLKPWRLSSCLKANKTLELATGSIKKFGLISGMKLEIKNV